MSSAGPTGRRVDTEKRDVVQMAALAPVPPNGAKPRSRRSIDATVNLLVDFMEDRLREEPEKIGRGLWEKAKQEASEGLNRESVAEVSEFEKEISETSDGTFGINGAFEELGRKKTRQQAGEEHLRSKEQQNQTQELKVGAQVMGRVQSKGVALPLDWNGVLGRVRDTLASEAHAMMVEPVRAKESVIAICFFCDHRRMQKA